VKLIGGRIKSLAVVSDEIPALNIAEIVKSFPISACCSLDHCLIDKQAVLRVLFDA